MLLRQSCVPSKQEKAEGEQAQCAGVVMCSRAGAQAGQNQMDPRPLLIENFCFFEIEILMPENTGVLGWCMDMGMYFRKAAQKLTFPF